MGKSDSTIFDNLRYFSQNQANPSHTSICTILTVLGFSACYRLFPYLAFMPIYMYRDKLVNTPHTCPASFPCNKKAGNTAQKGE
jgi:hypothetical protein